ncbi:MAG: bifunctional 4-hydroxy-3-methylbut-2-enyl diphosphate reductase/30S ribosomal protein S1 [Acutalibacteraceae bacterium]|nr:bifunctional 4-hydroxy-3-methylbut-2-enyl diphosphate reductase/30S ribosomal protein S1 [Acutalibacteraceae bacterium]
MQKTLHKKITLAQTAGFCFGVDRAVHMVYKLLDEGKKVCTLGPIIHNAEMVRSLKDRGALIARAPEEVPDDCTVVIRSHGVPLSVYDCIAHRKLMCSDATCPFVTKIHKTVYEQSKNGKVIFIIGDKDHPEVQGIQGHCTTESFTMKTPKEIEKLAINFPELKNKEICVVAQTTFDVSQWKKCLETVKKVYTNVTFFDTICSATSERQKEAMSLAEKSDLMVVIGDKSSSNSCKLYHICKEHCERTFFVQTSEDLDMQEIIHADSIGVTAGASTPARIIKEVLDKMTDMLNKSGETTMDNTETSFAQMLEENLKSFNTDGRVQGIVERITPNEVFVDVGRKQAGVVKLDELTDDPNAKTEDLVKIGDKLDLLIMRTNDQEGVIMLSKKRVDALKGWDIVVEAAENKEILTGIVTEVIKGGLLVAFEGMKIFIPASQATASRGEALENLLKQEVRFRIIDIDKKRRRAVGSIRSVLREENAKLREEFWKHCEVGKVYTGTVKSLTSYGAFVDIGGVDGMIHISELSWERIKHPSEVVQVGDTVEVYVKDIDKEKGNVSLGYKKTEDNPWEKLKNEYPVGTVVDVQIVGMTSFGAFAKILPGIDGLIHISQIANRRIEKPEDELSIGQTVQAKITAIDFEKKRVSLSIRALLEPEQEKQAVTEEVAPAVQEASAEETSASTQEDGAAAPAPAEEVSSPVAEDAAAPADETPEA